MAGDAVELSGFKELDAALAKFSKSTERALLRRVATRALEPFVTEAKRLAPVASGNLRDSITIGTKLTGNARREARRDPPDGVRVFAGTADREAVPNEFGTVRAPAQPFMRPAWDTTSNLVLARVMDDLADEIDRTAQRVAARAAKG
ncbi:HK97-gp10 family putative phage morphogenesis protein [Stakelama pacifica]|uniref:HK97 gp10 family phage protein n=1 Tax=Stakelama pacifica TaxID=517720 RepID=A0A4R6G060_9SPHN|nr:HK97-gp10 family putative phage morphogenesis protein [Stakelama pacifica]TDN86835.1 HK97 gp10 family phage protein [Stakelama pacifica]GGO90817.1 hypothetical protein GCM10011329_04060 [Stakelama pacifica]